MQMETMIALVIGFISGSVVSHYMGRSRVTKLNLTPDFTAKPSKRTRRKMIIQTELKAAQFEASNKERL